MNVQDGSKSLSGGPEEKIPAKISGSLVVSESLYNYVVQYNKIISLFMFLIDVSHRVDTVGEFIRKLIDAIDERGPIPSIREIANDLKFGDAGASRVVKQNADLLSRFLVCNSVENFLCYLSDALKVVISKKPALLFSSEMIKVEDALRHGSMKRLISHLVDRKVSDLSYMGIKDMTRYFSDRLGIVLTELDAERDLLSLFIEIRNIHVHNRGIVNDTFLQRTSMSTRPKVGSIYHVDFEEFVGLNNNLFRLALKLDEQLRTKFSLKARKFRTWTAVVKSKPSI